MRNLVLLVAVAAVARPSHASPPAMKVSDSGRYLVTVDSQPFFWLGDTAWRLIQKASRSDVDDQPSALRYFEKRSAQGFNVIQTVLVNVDIPANAAGHSPFVDDDFARPRLFPGPDNDFWDDVDWFVDQAVAHGLYLALLPTWNSSVPEDHPMVKDPAIAYRYGHFLGERYRGRSNIIWVLGGDPPPSRDVGVPQRLAMIRAMAEGLADVANGSDQQDGDADWTATLMTYHPRGGGQSSSKQLHAEPWLDFNMIQTTTRFEFTNYETVAADYALRPPKPTLDAEVAYEDSLSLNRKEPQDRRISPWDDPMAFLNPREPYFEAGAAVQYNDHDVFLLGKILTLLSGEPLQDIFQQRIAGPIGMTRWEWGVSGTVNGIALNNPPGNPGGAGAGGVKTTARELARFGLLYLNRGNWNGRQLLSASYVDQATTNQVPVNARCRNHDFRGRYGFYWWVNGTMASGNRPWPSAPPKTYTAHGRGCNFCFVIPEWSMVVVRLGTVPISTGNIAKGDRPCDEFFRRLASAIGEHVADHNR